MTTRAELLGEMWGERAIQAPFCMVATRTTPVEGAGRTMFGGCLLGVELGNDRKWTRWRGTAIFIPERIDAFNGSSGFRIDQMMVGSLGVDEHWENEWSAQP